MHRQTERQKTKLKWMTGLFPWLRKNYFTTSNQVRNTHEEEGVSLSSRDAQALKEAD